MNEYTAWREGLKKLNIPKWDDLPNIELYMDQVVAYVNTVLQPLPMPPITPAMVNNYVKKQVLMAPKKKKYQAMQIADIIIISMLKPVFSIEEIRAAIDQITVNDFPKNAYDTFVDALEDRFNGIMDTDFADDNLSLQLMRNAANIIYNKMEAEHLLDVLSRRTPVKTAPLKK